LYHSSAARSRRPSDDPARRRLTFGPICRYAALDVTPFGVTTAPESAWKRACSTSSPTLGLTRNEALAYLTLAQDAGAEGLTGYEVAARSGIPRSAVYTVLRRLEQSGAAFAIGDEPARYVPTRPDQLIETMRRGTLSRLLTLGDALKALPKRVMPEPIWILSRYDEVMVRAAEMIRGAARSVWLSAWPRELHRLGPALSLLPADLHLVLAHAHPRRRPAAGLLGVGG
jgi:DNA-binding MarR family transcriptional regulator